MRRKKGLEKIERTKKGEMSQTKYWVQSGEGKNFISDERGKMF